MQITNAASQSCNLQMSNVSGLLIVSPQSLTDFTADSTYTKHIDIAIADGINAAKKASDAFTLCYQTCLHNIEIEINLTDSMHTSAEQRCVKPTPSLKHDKIIPMPLPEAHEYSHMRIRFKQAALHFHNRQVHLRTTQQPETKPQSHYGFEVRVCVKAYAETAPDIEALYALQTALLSLFRIFKHDKMAVITQVRILQ